MPKDQLRDGHGRDFARDPKTAERHAQAAEMRSRGMTYQAIGDALGISKQSAHEAVQRVLAETLREPAEHLRTMELDKLDRAERVAHGVLEARHPVLYQGKDTGYEDDAPKLAAIDRLLRVAERRARLLGLDAPEKVESTVTTISPDLAEMIAQARAAVAD